MFVLTDQRKIVPLLNVRTINDIYSIFRYNGLVPIITTKFNHVKHLDLHIVNYILSPYMTIETYRILMIYFMNYCRKWCRIGIRVTISELLTSAFIKAALWEEIKYIELVFPLLEKGLLISPRECFIYSDYGEIIQLVISVQNKQIRTLIYKWMLIFLYYCERKLCTCHRGFIFRTAYGTLEYDKEKLNEYHNYVIEDPCKKFYKHLVISEDVSWEFAARYMHYYACKKHYLFEKLGPESYVELDELFVKSINTLFKNTRHEYWDQTSHERIVYNEDKYKEIIMGL